MPISAVVGLVYQGQTRSIAARIETDYIARMSIDKTITLRDVFF